MAEKWSQSERSPVTVERVAVEVAAVAAAAAAVEVAAKKSQRKSLLVD